MTDGTPPALHRRQPGGRVRVPPRGTGGPPAGAARGCPPPGRARGGALAAAAAARRGPRTCGVSTGARPPPPPTPRRPRPGRVLALRRPRQRPVRPPAATGSRASGSAAARTRKRRRRGYTGLGAARGGAWRRVGVCPGRTPARLAAGGHLGLPPPPPAPPSTWQLVPAERRPRPTAAVPPTLHFAFYPPSSSSGGGGSGGRLFAVGVVTLTHTLPPVVVPTGGAPLTGRYVLAADGDWLVVAAAPAGRVLFVTRRRVAAAPAGEEVKVAAFDAPAPGHLPSVLRAYLFLRTGVRATADAPLLPTATPPPSPLPPGRGSAWVADSSPPTPAGRRRAGRGAKRPRAADATAEAATSRPAAGRASSAAAAPPPPPPPPHGGGPAATPPPAGDGGTPSAATPTAAAEDDTSSVCSASGGSWGREEASTPDPAVQGRRRCTRRRVAL
ncbi:hypothetical protein BU14_0465s0009 [Porphyra umbilicalis]|uniref:Uncharacterized protein n=1 Tax=Porphyra umbilicalis TaxID=2786 RepID=A0A1X6NU33_PORUM|nr:hypothetical protein BU14_0465s0009 [Porphyra umbilicalis]|eukprot:OSX72118.1 hypothetical protein BU14_0465s0009 [Porphyra umbilicalis]